MELFGILFYIAIICTGVAIVLRLYMLMTAAQRYLEEKTEALRRKNDN